MWYDIFKDPRKLAVGQKHSSGFLECRMTESRTVAGGSQEDQGLGDESKGRKTENRKLQFPFFYVPLLTVHTHPPTPPKKTHTCMCLLLWLNRLAFSLIPQTCCMFWTALWPSVPPLAHAWVLPALPAQQNRCRQTANKQQVWPLHWWTWESIISSCNSAWPWMRTICLAGMV